MATLKEELAQLRARQRPGTTPAKEKLRKPPLRTGEESVRRREDANRRRELERWGQDTEEEGVTVPFAEWQKSAWKDQLAQLRERIQSGEARGPGLQAPMREEPIDILEPLYPTFDPIGEQYPNPTLDVFMRPSSVVDKERWNFEDYWNFYAREPRRLRRGLREDIRSGMKGLKRRIGF